VIVRLNRREFLKKTGILTAAAALHTVAQDQVRVRPAFNGASLKPFVDALPLPPVAHRTGTRPDPDSHREVPFYRVSMREFDMQLHRDLPPTRMWGYNSSFPGPTIEARTGSPLIVEWSNDLPRRHFLPIDYHLHGAERDQPEVRAVVHVHGAKVRAHNDGYPEDWYESGKSAVYHYPNQQDAAVLWYHDHAMGINRLNIFAGLAGAYIIRDDFEDSLHLPRGEYEIPLVICDRMLDTKGQLYYPDSLKPGAPWIADFSGDILLVNGKVRPYLDVEPRKYRFRFLNVANSRFFNLALSNKEPLIQIGSDQGLLAAPVQLPKLLIAPAERADLVIDFAKYRGQEIFLFDSNQPLMQFRVKSGAPDSTPLPGALRPVPRTEESLARKNRMLSLDEWSDRFGDSMIMLLNGSRWHDPITEKPLLNSVEIWNLINTTDDPHPIHLHLVRFQVLDRRRFDKFQYQLKNTLRFMGDPMPPAPNEAGWKDTVRAESGAVTRIIVRFEGYAGRYVWHCHNLEHEDNEMMRPYEVVATAAESDRVAAAAPAAIPICYKGNLLR